MKKIALVDINILIYSIVFSQKNSMNRERVNLLNDKINIIKEISKPDKILFCLDKKDENNKYWRNYILESYKGKRKELEPDVGLAIRDLRCWIQETYLDDVIVLAGIEADDLIYMFCKKYHEKFNIDVISCDKDLHQIFNFKNCNYLNSRSKTESGFEYIYKKGISVLTHEKFLKIVSGDYGDNVLKITKTRLTNKIKNELWNEFVDSGYKKIREEWDDNFQINNRLINLENIDLEVKDKILNIFKKIKI